VIFELFSKCSYIIIVNKWDIQRDMLSFFDVVRPPELLQFVDDVVPILHGERTFTSHHDCHDDVVVGAIDIRVPKPISDVERLALFALLQVISST